LDDGQLKMDKIYTYENPMDMFTKVVTREKLNSSSASVGLLDLMESNQSPSGRLFLCGA
jgi:hypothetical protein